MSAAEQQTLSRDALKKFRVILAAVRQHMSAVEQACGVSGAQVWVLAVLSERPGLRVSQVAEALSVHQSTISNLLDKMEQANLVRRERSRKDQRVVEVYLTETGNAVLEKAPRPFTGVLLNALEALPKNVLARLDDDLKAVIGHLNSEVDMSAAVKPLI
jgi:DNA-binding MarR family transcriptional regulator